MKKTLVLVLLMIAFFSCKNDQKTETTVEEQVESEEIKPGSTDRTVKQSDGLILLKGNFIYYSEAAVFQTPSEIYGVVVDDKMHELNEQAKQFKDEETDMVVAVIRGKISKKSEGEEVWDNRIEIKEILKVSKSSSNENEVIKLGSK